MTDTDAKRISEMQENMAAQDVKIEELTKMLSTCVEQQLDMAKNHTKMTDNQHKMARIIERMSK